MKIKILSLFLLFFVSSVSYAQYKYDIGLKTSTNSMERFQLEGRFHLKSPLSLVSTLTHHSNVDLYQTYDNHEGDSTLTYASERNSVRYLGLKFGVQRRIRSLASDCFYAGFTVGMNHQNQRFHTETTLFEYDSIPTVPYDFSKLTEISNSISNDSYGLLHTQLALSFGMDVPVTQHWLINVEVGLSGIFSKYIGQQTSYAEVIGVLSGGIRYQFARRKRPETGMKNE